MTVFGLGELDARADVIRERFPDCEPEVVPLLMRGDVLEHGAVGVGKDGEMYWVHAKGREMGPSGDFEAELLASLGDVVVVDENKEAGRTPRFAVAFFATSDEADAFVERLDAADAGEGALDFVSEADEKKLEILPFGGGLQVLIAHSAPRKFDEERIRAVCKEAGATTVLTTWELTFCPSDRSHVIPRERRRRTGS